MKTVFEKHGNTPVKVEYLHVAPDPEPTRLHGNHLTAMGFACKGSMYTKHGLPSISYDGCNWWIEGTETFNNFADMRVDTLEQLKQILQT